MPTSDLFGIPKRPVGTLILYNNNGHGSTATNIIRYSSQHSRGRTNFVEYKDDAVMGTTIQIKEAGMYYLSATDARTAGALVLAISLNSTQLASAPQVINAEDVLAIVNTGTSGAPDSCSIVCFLQPGDIIRPHDEGTADGSSNSRFSRFVVSKIWPV